MRAVGRSTVGELFSKLSFLGPSEKWHKQSGVWHSRGLSLGLDEEEALNQISVIYQPFVQWDRRRYTPLNGKVSNEGRELEFTGETTPEQVKEVWGGPYYVHHGDDFSMFYELEDRVEIVASFMPYESKDRLDLQCLLIQTPPIWPKRAIASGTG